MTNEANEHESVAGYMDTNRANWNERVNIHVADQTGFYDVEGFLAGNDTLMPIEAAELGDVKGTRILHLQCHFGLDTLSLARRGAVVTGLDFSEKAIAAARNLAEAAKLDTEFVCGNIYDTAKLIEAASFDLVYSTWGTINWLPDIGRWADIVGYALGLKGQLYLADKHPSFDQLIDGDGKLVFEYPFRCNGVGGALPFDVEKSYTGDGRPLRNRRTYEWLHPMSDIVNALRASGLSILSLSEHDTLPWRACQSMVEVPDRMYRLPHHIVGPPASFSLRAVKDRLE